MGKSSASDVEKAREEASHWLGRLGRGLRDDEGALLRKWLEQPLNRKTIADCMADNNYGHLAELARQQGMGITCEAGGPSWSGTLCMDVLKYLGRCDVPQGEFWQGQYFVV